MTREEKDDATLDLEAVTAAAKRLKLNAADTRRYIHEHMTGFGYKSSRSYFKPKGESSGRSFFGKGSDDDDDDDDE
jgi:CobQ-like glutamine amidotransferase family enzyme